MLGHASFSSLRLSRIFSQERLESFPFFVAVDPRGEFDTEYMGGQWHEELIDGVQFFYPACDGEKLGIIELWGGGCVMSAAVRDRPELISASLVPGWTANVDRVLETLELPFRMGSDETAVCALAAGRVRRSGFPDRWYELNPAVTRGALRSLSFACRAPDIYHIKAVIHSGEGLLKVELRRPDLVRSNGSEGAYDACFASLFDEG